jgi:TonB family protein
METVASPPVDDELHLLTEWGDPSDRNRERRAALWSVGLHAIAILVIVLIPASVYTSAQPERQVVVVRRVTPLIEPLTELTQKAPNTRKISKEINAADLEPKPRIQTPAPAPVSPPKLRPAPAPPVQVARQASPPPLPEPPKVDPGSKESPKSALPPLVTPPPPPQIQAEEKPKSPFVTPNAPTTPAAGVGQGRFGPPPDPSVEGAVRQLARQGEAGGRQSVGDSDLGSAGGSGITMSPTPGSQGNQVQLLSDPMGVDFKPYLIRVLASVKLHWLAVIPESVKLGRRGQVAIQFSIARDGSVPKLVIANSSGADPLDRAAVAGISASTPFPPLPGEYKGDRIVLQFNFGYNVPKQ